MLGFSSIIGQMTDDERFISKFSADPRNVLIEYISFRNFRCRYWGILDGSILGQETSQKRGAFNSSGLSRSEIREKARRRIAKRIGETFTKSLFETVRYDPRGYGRVPSSFIQSLSPPILNPGSHARDSSGTRGRFLRSLGRGPLLGGRGGECKRGR